MSLKEEHKPWHRFFSKGETQQAWDLFLIYCYLGAKRSATLVAKETNYKYTEAECQSMCTTFHWQRRARAFDTHLREVKEKAIENLSAEQAIVVKEREIDYRENCFQLSERLRLKIDEMLTFPLSETIVVETVPVIINGQAIDVEKTIIHKPVKWTLKDLYAMAEVQDKMHRMSFGAPTSRVAHSVETPKTLEERIEEGRAKIEFYIKNRLEKAVQRTWERNTSLNPNEIRQELLNELPVWTAEDLGIPDVQLLLGTGEPDIEVLPLDENDFSDVGAIN